MPKLIKNSEIIDNTAQILDKDFSGDLPPSNKDTLVFAPLCYLVEHSGSMKNAISEGNGVGVWIDSDESPEALAPFLEDLQYIAINFPKFSDGRGYSYARILRDRYGYKGELRAIGDVLHDQLFFYKRCGFDVFVVREDKDIKIAHQGLNDFSNSYQVSTDQPLPLFRRR